MHLNKWYYFYNCTSDRHESVYMSVGTSCVSWKVSQVRVSNFPDDFYQWFTPGAALIRSRIQSNGLLGHEGGQYKETVSHLYKMNCGFCLERDYIIKETMKRGRSLFFLFTKWSKASSNFQTKSYHSSSLAGGLLIITCLPLYTWWYIQTLS